MVETSETSETTGTIAMMPPPNQNNAHDVENLVSLCMPCHRKWEGIPLRPEGSV